MRICKRNTYHKNCLTQTFQRQVWVRQFSWYVFRLQIRMPLKLHSCRRKRYKVSIFVNLCPLHKYCSSNKRTQQLYRNLSVRKLQLTKNSSTFKEQWAPCTESRTRNNLSRTRRRKKSTSLGTRTKTTFKDLQTLT